MTQTTSAASLEHTIGAAGRFHLRQFSGEIRVRGVDGDAVRVHERNGKSLRDTFAIEAEEGSLSLVAPSKGGIDLLVFGVGRRSSVDLDVELPRGATVSVETASADTKAHGLTGELRFRTASGDLELTEIGGSLELDSVSGEVDVHAVAPLALRARTISGDVAVRAPVLGRASIESTSGDVRLDAVLAGPGPFEIRSVSGDATIVGRSGIRVEARTVTGNLHSDLPHRSDTGPGRKQLVVGDGGTAIAFRSVSGDLRVIQPRDALAPGALDHAASAVPGAPVAPVPPNAPVAPMAPRPPEAAAVQREASHEVARLDLLKALERGDLSVEAAIARLAEIEEA